ncbi:MAG: hypothetical protein K2H19_09915, partial [Ruminococcus sp.]|nr:hypothetical protein [Ruminococcus sp.]
IIFDITVLFSFRMNFFALLDKLFNFPESFFPIGISLFTLSAVGYLIDVYEGRIKAEINFIRFGLFIMMFPKLLMGPVISYDNFIHIVKKKKITMNELGAGLNIFIKGLAKKVIVADTLFSLYSAIKSCEIRNISAVSAWLGIISYILCLYFTLSGVSDMGTGIARCFGFQFQQSFNYPIFSSRIHFFTTKWHIHVVHWFRKYIVRPLASKMTKSNINILVYIFVWLLIGFWYKFSLNGVIWGILMGMAIAVEDKIKKVKMLKSTGIIYTFLVTTVLAVFLSENNISDSLYYLFAMIGGNRIFADSLTAYLLKSYIVILLAAMYASTDLFKSTIERLYKTRFRWVALIVSPLIMVLTLAVCTAIISYTGSSEMILIQL